MAELTQFDYMKIKKEDIFSFMESNATEEEQGEFYEACFEAKKQKTLVPVYLPGTDTPVIVRKKNKTTGQYELKPKMEMVEVEGTTARETYNHRKAVQWFVAKYDGVKITVTNKPGTKPKKKQDTEKKIPAIDLFASFKPKKAE